MRTRSIFSNLCFGAGALFVCFACGGILPLSFPGGGFVPLLTFTGIVGLCAYIRTRPPSLRSIARASPLGWLLAIPVGGSFLLGYFYHLLWLLILALLTGIVYQLYQDSVCIRAYNATHPA